MLPVIPVIYSVIRHRAASERNKQYGGYCYGQYSDTDANKEDNKKYPECYNPVSQGHFP